MTRSLSGPTPGIPYWADWSVLLGGLRSSRRGCRVNQAKVPIRDGTTCNTLCRNYIFLGLQFVT